MKWTLLLLLSAVQSTAASAESRAFPDRQDGFSPVAWGSYTRQMLLEHYPEHGDIIRNLTVYIAEQERTRLYIGVTSNEKASLMVITRAWIDAIRTPDEFLLVAGHELGHLVLQHTGRMRVIEDLAFRGQDGRALLRITQEEMDADLFAVLEVHGMAVAQSTCSLHEAHRHILPLWMADHESNRWERWHIRERLNLLDRWCRLAREQASSIRLFPDKH